MICPVCKATRGLADRHCFRCGGELVRPQCPHCKVGVGVDEKFCRRCGREVPAGVREALKSLDERPGFDSPPCLGRMGVGR